MRKFLTGQRITDPPPDKQPFQFRTALAARKYPVQIALVIALLAACIPVYLLVQSNSDLRRSNRQLRSALLTTVENRKATVNVFCRVINGNTVAINAQSQYIQGLIIGGAKSSHAFEHVFRSLGLPPYKKRLAQAVKQASGLKKLKVPPLDCGQLERELLKQVHQVKTATG